jgi:hypothetical protein
MPKENTHLFFADRLLHRFPDPDILLLLKENRNPFFLGAVLPDAFYYHPRKDVTGVSKRLHGITDNPGDIIAAFIHGAREHRSPPDAAFALGYLSHCLLDRAFHPTIRILTGDYDDPDPEKRKASQYRHRLIETALDRRINDSCRLDRMIALGPLSSLSSLRILSARSGVARKRLYRAYSLQRRANRLFRKTWAYRVARIIQKAGNSDIEIILPLFYAHLNVDPCAFPDTVPVPADDENKQRQGGIDDLLDAADASAERGFHAAYRLFQVGSAPERSRLLALVPDKF